MITDSGYLTLINAAWDGGYASQVDSEVVRIKIEDIAAVRFVDDLIELRYPSDWRWEYLDRDQKTILLFDDDGSVGSVFPKQALSRVARRIVELRSMRCGAAEKNLLDNSITVVCKTP